MARKRQSKKMVPSRPRPRRRGGQRPSSDKLVHDVCGLTDPFCIHADGARWSDDVGQTATITYQSRSIITVSSDANGRAALYIDPAYALNAAAPGAVYRQLTLAGVVATAGNPVTIPDSTLANLLASDVTTGARLISAGATWWDVVPATGAGGRVIASEITNFKAYSNMSSGTFGVNNAVLSPNVQVSDRRQPNSWICRPSNPMAYNFLNSQDSDDLYQEIRTALILAVSGPASTPLIEIELVMNFEFTVTVESVYSRLATPHPTSASNRLAAKTAGKLESAMQPFIEGGKASVGRYITNLAKSAANAAMRAAGAYVGGMIAGPVGAGAGYAIMDVD